METRTTAIKKTRPLGRYLFLSVTATILNVMLYILLHRGSFAKLPNIIDCFLLISWALTLDVHLNNLAAKRESQIPTANYVKDISHALPLSIRHILGYERVKGSTSIATTTRYKEFPLSLSPCASSPEPSEFKLGYTCPECGSQLELVAKQRVGAIVAPDDFRSHSYSSFLKSAFLRSRLRNEGLPWCIYCALPLSFLFTLGWEVAQHPRQSVAHLAGMLLLDLILAIVAVLGIVAAIRYRGLSKPALFIVSSSQSVLWRYFPHERLFVLIIDVDMTTASEHGKPVEMRERSQSLFMSQETRGHDVHMRRHWVAYQFKTKAGTDSTVFAFPKDSLIDLYKLPVSSLRPSFGRYFEL